MSPAPNYNWIVLSNTCTELIVTAAQVLNASLSAS